MQCPQCQHENSTTAKFCEECGTRLVHTCSNCEHEVRPQAKFCEECGTSLTSSASAPQVTKPDAESRFHALLPAVMWVLQRDRRVLYRELKHIFGVDDTLLEGIREALTFKRLAIDEDNKGLVWTDEAQPAMQPVVAVPNQPVTATPTPRPETEALTPSNGSTTSAEPITTSGPQDEPAVTTEPVRSPPEAERRQLTVMFCDLADSTKLSQQLDPEELREVVRAYQASAAEVIEQYEGHLAQYLGDGLLVYFGWPVAHEDDAQRAAHAGLGIVEAITTTLNPRLEQEKGVQLTVRIGVHTGPVVVGEMGGGGRHENLATGETVNITARLEGLAASNTVVLSQVTARLVRGAFALEDLGRHALKGVADPMPVFRVLGAQALHEDERGAGVPFLVGRDEEVGLLLRRWEQSKEGSGQVVLISGEAGIGKSSLVATVRHHVRQEGYTRLTFRCSPYHTNSALYPVITHLEQVLGLEPEDTPDLKLDKLEAVLRTTRLPLEASVALMASLLSVPLEDRYAAAAWSPQQQRQQTLDTLVAWLMEEAERQPVLATWEDLHWGDPSTLEILGLLLEQTPTVPMLHLLTFRPEFEQPWPTRSHMMPITLNRLERSQVEALITHLAGAKALPAEVIEHIVTKTDGVPLYVEELTRMLLESDLLLETGNQYQLTGALLTVAIPDTLQDALMARLDQLHTAKEAAQLGAVFGREFTYDMLCAISPQDEPILQAGLDQLVTSELLYQRGRPPHAKYIFKHALIRDMAYASLLRSTRQRVHQHIAELFEARFLEMVDTQPEVVAQHYTEGGCHQQAIQYWQRAGQQAFQRSANQEAIHHVTTGLDLLPHLPDSPERDQTELDLQLILAPALIATKGYASPEVQDVCNRMGTLCQQLGDISKLLPALFDMWLASMGQGDLPVAMTFAEQCLGVAQRQQERSALLVAHWSLGVTSFYLGQFVDAHRHADQGIAYDRPEQHDSQAYLYGQDPGMTCLMVAARALWMLGYPEQALNRGREALTLARKLAHPYSTAFVLAQLAVVHQFRREAHEVCERSAELIALCSQEGFAGLRVMGTILQGWGLAARGEEHDGMAQIYQSLDINSSSAGLGQPPVLTQLAEIHWKIGQTEEGLRVLTQALEVMDHTQERWWEAELHRLKGELLLNADGGFKIKALSPKDCFQQALRLARQQQARSLELRAAMSLARLWQSQDKRQEAFDLLAPVYEWFTEGFDTADLQEAKALLDALRA
jgi:class 3 adenylate cyclase/tetratricopeptide (TPR) repeat protein